MGLLTWIIVRQRLLLYRLLIPCLFIGVHDNIIIAEKNFLSFPLLFSKFCMFLFSH